MVREYHIVFRNTPCDCFIMAETPIQAIKKAASIDSFYKDYEITAKPTDNSNSLCIVQLVSHSRQTKPKYYDIKVKPLRLYKI